MNKPPSILVDTGFEVDQNGALTEIVTPNVVATLNAPTKITFNGTTLNYIPSTVAALQEFVAPNVTKLGGNLFTGYTNLTRVNMPELLEIGSSSSNLFKGCTGLVSVSFAKLEAITSGGSSNGTFLNCSNLTNIDMPRLSSIVCTGGNINPLNGIFSGCSSLTSLTFPSLRTIQSANMFTPFYGMTWLTTVSMPKLSSTSTTVGNWGVFYGLTGLQTVTLGSEGHPVNSISSATFQNCTQSGLTITIYTTGGAALSGSPWGATNATIVWEEA